MELWRKLVQGFTLFGKNTEFVIDSTGPISRTSGGRSFCIATQALFYNLDGKSYANSLQLELNYEITHHFR